jgi:heme/copper-type cytochrome/quinol oxidase subunit 3
MHVFSGVVYLSCLLVRALLGKYENPHNNEIEIGALYWHFVDLIWILVFTFVYLI